MPRCVWKIFTWKVDGRLFCRAEFWRGAVIDRFPEANWRDTLLVLTWLMIQNVRKCTCLCLDIVWEPSDIVNAADRRVFCAGIVETNLSKIVDWISSNIFGITYNKIISKKYFNKLIYYNFGWNIEKFHLSHYIFGTWFDCILYIRKWKMHFFPYAQNIFSVSQRSFLPLRIVIYSAHSRMSRKWFCITFDDRSPPYPWETRRKVFCTEKSRKKFPLLDFYLSINLWNVLGHVALSTDDCPICRSILPMQVLKVSDIH